MKMNLGMTYQGSKNGVAPRIVDAMPGAETFVDLFFGGGSVSHAAMLSGKYRNFIANDLRRTPQAWNRCVDGVGGEYDRFVSREEFRESEDPVLKIIWSFGGSANTYACKGLKEDIFRLIMSDDFETRYEMWRKVLKPLRELALDGVDIYKKLHACNPASTIRRIKSLNGRGKHVIASNLDYRKVQIPENSVVYCDPPYKDTHGYGVEFDHDAFWEWCRTRDFPVYVSEIKAPTDFKPVLTYEKQAKFSKDSGWREEGLFVHERWIKGCV